jgi:hypothetical protein
MTMSTRLLRSIAILCSIAAPIGCRGPGQSLNAQRTVTVYVSTDRVFSEPVLREYEKRSGVRVNTVYDTDETKSTGLANRLIAEQARPQADVFWSNEPIVPWCSSREVCSRHIDHPAQRGFHQPSSTRRNTGLDSQLASE